MLVENSERSIIALIESFAASPKFFEERLFMFYSLVPFLQYKQCEMFLKTVESGIQGKADLVSLTYNPIKACVLILYVNSALMSSFPFCKIYVDRINTRLYEIANKIIDSAEDSRDLEVYLLDTTLFGREVLEIMNDLSALPLFKSPAMDNVVSNFWIGPYETTGSILEESFEL